MSKYSWKSYVFSISNFLHGKVCPPKKCQRSSIEETLGYRTVSTVLCANSDFKSYQVNTQSLKIQIRRLRLVRKRTNQVRFDFFLTFSSIQRQATHFNRCLTDCSSANWDRMHFCSKKCIFKDFAISSLLVMISDILQRRKMISVKISTRKKCIETDLKTFCKSWEEAGGNTLI